MSSSRTRVGRRRPGGSVGRSVKRPERASTPAPAAAPSEQLPKALGNQTLARLAGRGLEVAPQADSREHEATDAAQRGGPVSPAQAEAGGVRLHTHPAAAKMAEAVESRAFTIGKDIFFGAGQFDPASAAGNQLVQHELAHATRHDDPSHPTLFRQPLPGAQTESPPAGLTLTPEIPPPSVVRSEGATLATIYFGQGDFLLGDSRAIAVVQQLAQELRFAFEPTVNVDGFASSEGTDAFNLELSQKRREAVIALLRGELTQPVTFGGAAHGEADPAAPETGGGAELERHRARNRRVEIFIAQRMPQAPEPTVPDLRPRFEPRPETDEERLERIIREEPPARPPDISLSEALGRRFDEAVDSALRRTNLSRAWRERIRSAARAAAAGAAEKALDSAIDAAPLGSEERDALKAAIRAAMQTPSVPQ
jgi:outer membrane protein OmpA-like peptidoglycan-associated protein